jgi:hypothetical protein
MNTAKAQGGIGYETLRSLGSPLVGMCFVAMLGFLLSGVPFGELASSALAQGSSTIPTPPPGNYSQTEHGSFAICLNPAKDYAEQACGQSGVQAFPLSSVIVGAVTTDASGNACASESEVDADIPPAGYQPTVTLNEHSTSKVTSYDSSTGFGSGSFTGYTGGSCNGASFDSSGATEISSGTFQFVVTENGKRVDYIITQLTNPTNSIADFEVDPIFETTIEHF